MRVNLEQFTKFTKFTKFTSAEMRAKKDENEDYYL